MIKVECVSCKSPYDVDERRVPEKGMKMRCPKCGTSFVVARDGTTSAAAAAAPLAMPVAPAIASPPMAAPGIHNKTLVGQEAPRPLSEPGMPAVSAPPAPAAPAAPAKLGKGTVMGIAPPIMASSAPVTPRVPDLIDLPAVKPGAKPAVPWGSLAPPAQDNKAAAPRIAPVGGLPKGMGGVSAAPPATTPAKTTATASAFGAPVAPAAPQPTAAAFKSKTMVGHQVPVAPVASATTSFTDLPAVKGVPNASVGASPDVTDLPAPKAAAPKLAPKAPVAAAPAAASPSPIVPPGAAKHAANDFGMVDLPAPKPGARPGMQFGDFGVDLPAPKAPAPKPAAKPVVPEFGEIDLPAPKLDADLPAPKAAPKAAKPNADFGDLDLPAPKHVTDLPAPKQIADLPTPKQLTDLPAPKQIADLPVPKQLADLPAPKQIADLPVPKQIADLPVPKQLADLPVPKSSSGFGDLDLPVPKLTQPGSPDEASFGDLELPDLLSASEPPGRPGSGGFGDIELPPPRANMIPPKAPTLQGAGAPRGRAGDESSFGDLNADSELPPSLMSGMGDDESSFGDLNPDDQPVRVGQAVGQGASLPPLELGSMPPALRNDGGASELEDSDDFGEVSLPDDGEGQSEEDMEFGIAEGAGEDGGFALPPEILRRQRGEDVDAADAAKGKRARVMLIAVAAALDVIGPGGAALSFTDSGLFGIYYLERYLPEAGDPVFVRDAIARAEKTASSDSYHDVRKALALLGEARHKAGLNRELLTRSVLHEALFQLRFGSDSASSSHVASIMLRLEERHGIAPGMALARAAEAARTQDWANASTQLDAARAESPDDAYVDLIAAESALRQGKLAEAEKYFTSALKHGASARAQWGLARVAIAKHDQAGERAAIEETLKLSPRHVEARVADARVLWTEGKEERAMQELRQALGQELDGDQYLWTSKSAQAVGFALVGYIHESRGRLHLARKAYDDALSADPYLVDALLGAGRVMLREHRYNDALARFESALNVAQKSGGLVALSGRKADVEARLGQGRAQLALDRNPEARTVLAGLMNENPNDAEIVLSVGQVEEALGNKQPAEADYRKSIELDPSSFSGYLALSQFYFKLNQADKASEVLNEAATKVEETAEMRRMLGQSEMARNRYDSAIHEFKRAVELDAQDLEAVFGLGVAYRKTGELDKARALFEQIGTRDTHFAGLSLERGQLYEAQGAFDKAVQSYREALEKDPSDNNLMLHLGGAQVETGALDDAEQTLSKVIHEIPNSADAEYFIGRVAFARGRGPDALTHFDRALSLDGTQPAYHLYAGRAALEMGNLGRTLEEMETTLKRDPSMGDAYWVRGIVRLRAGAVKDALKDLQKAMTLNPGRTEALGAIAECYDELRQLPLAIQTFRSALEKNPNNGEWWYKLGRIYLDQGERGVAEESLRHALELGDKADPMPYWLPDVYRLSGEIARVANNKKTAITLYKRYLEIAPDGALDREEVRGILKGWDVELDQ